MQPQHLLPHACQCLHRRAIFGRQGGKQLLKPWQRARAVLAVGDGVAVLHGVSPMPLLKHKACQISKYIYFMQIDDLTAAASIARVQVAAQKCRGLHMHKLARRGAQRYQKHTQAACGGRSCALLVRVASAECPGRQPRQAAPAGQQSQPAPVEAARRALLLGRGASCVRAIRNTSHRWPTA